MKVTVTCATCQVGVCTDEILGCLGRYPRLTADLYVDLSPQFAALAMANGGWFDASTYTSFSEHH